MSSIHNVPLMLYPIVKGIEGLAGEVKGATKLLSGSNAKQMQSQILLSTNSLVNVPVTVSPHRTLNTSKGIVLDIGHCLSHMTQTDIVAELHSQGVTDVSLSERITKLLKQTLIL